MATFLSNLEFQLTETLSTTWLIVHITWDLERWLTINADKASIVFKSFDWQYIERCIWTASNWLLTLSKRWLTQDDTQIEDTTLKREWRAWTKCYITALAFDLVDKDTWSLRIYANATARDAYITSPWVWMQCYLLAEGYFTDYDASGWKIRNIWWIAPWNASTTVAWVVELSTWTEVMNWTWTWWAWPLVIPWSYVKYCKATKSVDQLWIPDSSATFVTLDTFSTNDSWMSATPNQITITQDWIYKICWILRSDLLYEAWAYIRVILYKNWWALYNATTSINAWNYWMLWFSTVEKLVSWDIIRLQYLWVKPTPATSVISSPSYYTNLIVSSI